ncbi:MAG: hypothetical protein H0V89_11190 [Deltaproteobacteria bacterium]|nr:hypothetical protein [Deltaproteobacteria bacterium]
MARRLEDLARDLDLAVYRLERPPAAGPDLGALRRELEWIRDRVVTTAREVDR